MTEAIPLLDTNVNYNFPKNYILRIVVTNHDEKEGKNMSLFTKMDVSHNIH